MNQNDTASRKKSDFLDSHIPHRLCLLTTFWKRQGWFRNQMEGNSPDNDLLRCAKDSALISIRLFANFLGLRYDHHTGKLQYPHRPANGRHVDTDVYVDQLGGKLVPNGKLTPIEEDLLAGLLARADRELAHLTTRFEGHDEFNTAEAICDGAKLIERLLREHLYDVIGRDFPLLEKEKAIYEDGWNFSDIKVLDKTCFGK